jgi:hypothetical protein
MIRQRLAGERRVTKEKTKQHRSKKLSKMKPATTVRGTAGVGFDFEDRVGAWQVLSILSGQPLDGVSGRGLRIQCQTDKLGWVVDDLLISTAEDDQVYHLAISCKGNPQVTAAGLPNDFVTRAWQQWSSSLSGGPMKRNGEW